MRSTNPDFSIPLIRDELRYATRHALMQNPARDTLTFRNRQSETALPMRQLGSFLPGEGVGGAGVHWNGVTWRWTTIDHALRTHYEQRYGKALHPAGHAVQDWPMTYPELEPYYDRFERTAGVSGKAGNLRGQKQPGGNVFEAPRDRDYPLPPLEQSYAQVLFDDAAREAGYHPFPRPSRERLARVHQPRRLAARRVRVLRSLRTLRLRGQREGQPAHHRHPAGDGAIRTSSCARIRGSRRCMLDSTKRNATGVVYTDVSTGEEYEQPASIVALCAYAINNVHLMLLSGIGTPYDAADAEGRRRPELLLPARRRRRDAVFRGQDLQPVHGDRRVRHRARRLSRQRPSSIARRSAPLAAPRSRSDRATGGRSATARSRRARRAGAPNGRRPRRSGTCGR